MMFKKLTMLAAAAVVAVSAGSAMADGHMKNLRIGVEGAYPPFSSKTASGDLVGFDIDIAMALCEKLKAKCELVEQDWDGIIPALLARKYDAIISSMTITEERRKRIDFSKKYYHDPAKFVAREGAFSDDSPLTLAGKTIGVQRGTTHDSYVSALYPDSDIKRYATQDEVYLDLLTGRLDAGLANSVALAEGAKRLPSGQTALLSTLETPLAPIFAFFLFTEIPNAATFLGGALVLVAVLASMKKEG